MAKAGIKSGQIQKKSLQTKEYVLHAGSVIQRDTKDLKHFVIGTVIAAKSSIPFLNDSPPLNRKWMKGSKDKLAILNTQYSTCLITDVTDTIVIAETLIDKENNFTQTRRFDKLPLEDVIDCKEGTIFNLAIITKPGSREFIYTPGNPDDIKYFEETFADITSLINDLKNDPVFNHGPILNDDGDSF